MNKILSIIFLISGSIMAQQFTPKEAFLEKWQNSKTYLLEIAELMPEEGYVFKPTEREMDFKNQLLHIRGNMLWLGTTHFSKDTFDRKSLTQNVPSTKAETIKVLTQAFDYVYNQVNEADPIDFKTEVDFFAGRKSKLQILNLLQDHVTHHRGQLIVYLNLNEIEPPGYVGW
ncbi:DinB family protein [Aquimarina sp. AU474]|uniref:DinB family protein n=1 Tax=Aquimarina sp. AU474 TaxID=2108529 RepID=UPI000D69DD7C|nr:DinB family protein [Aquimarina sp. AU474]